MAIDVVHDGISGNERSIQGRGENSRTAALNSRHRLERAQLGRIVGLDGEAKLSDMSQVIQQGRIQVAAHQQDPVGGAGSIAHGDGIGR